MSDALESDVTTPDTNLSLTDIAMAAYIAADNEDWERAEAAFREGRRLSRRAALEEFYQ